MINPRFLTPRVKKFRDPRFKGGKIYVPFLHKPLARKFWRASEAMEYASQVKRRWVSLKAEAVHHG
jgi:hypothetical protein